MCRFTGRQAVAEKLTLDLRGRVKLADAGYDWKILGPDVSATDTAFVEVVPTTTTTIPTTSLQQPAPSHSQTI